MAVVLMIGAGLLIRSLWTLQQVDPGFVAFGVLKAEFQLPSRRYPQDYSKFPNWPAHQTFYGDLLSRLATVAGVRDVALAAANPLDAGFTSSIRVVGREAEGRDWPEPSVRAVSESYFRTVRLPLAAGRTFVASDDARSVPVAMINEAANRRYFGGQDAIGQVVRLWGNQRTVIGIVGNERFKGLAVPAAGTVPAADAGADRECAPRANRPCSVFARVRRPARRAQPGSAACAVRRRAAH